MWVCTPVAVLSYLVLVGDIKRIELKPVAGVADDNTIEPGYYRHEGHRWRRDSMLLNIGGAHNAGLPAISWC